MLTMKNIARYKWISCETVWTAAHRHMIDYFALSIQSAGVGTWIYTLLSSTNLISLTVSAQCALWSTTYIWITFIFCYACAYAIVTFRIWTTWWRVAWIQRCFICFENSQEFNKFKTSTHPFAKLFRKKKLPWTGFNLQKVKGSPLKPSLHVQIDTWFLTVHCAFCPQEPGHGSMQRSFTQDSELKHSWLVVHSGRQFGGLPK